HLRARYVDPEPGVQRGDPADRRGFPTRVALAEDHVSDAVRTHPGALDQLTQHGGSEGRDRDVAALPAEAAHRGADRFADDALVQRCPSALSLASLFTAQHAARGARGHRWDRYAHMNTLSAHWLRCTARATSDGRTPRWARCRHGTPGGA